jgi:uncharacterized protein (TIGR02284 family)
MSLPDETVITILRELMEISKDGEQGYKDASDDIKDKDMSIILFEFSVQRGEFVNKLRETIQKLGGATEFSGSVLGILHRRWMDVKFAVAGSDPSLVLTECLRGDRAALNKYEIQLDRVLPDNVRAVILNQYEIVKFNFDSITKLLEKHNLAIAKA